MISKVIYWESILCLFDVQSAEFVEKCIFGKKKCHFGKFYLLLY